MRLVDALLDVVNDAIDEGLVRSVLQMKALAVGST